MGTACLFQFPLVGTARLFHSVSGGLVGTAHLFQFVSVEFVWTARLFQFVNGDSPSISVR